MFKINGLPILVPIWTITHDLHLALVSSGKKGFEQLRNTRDGITCCCPFPDHYDSSPSFGIFQRDDTLWFKCFSCGKKGTLSELISKLLFNRYDDIGSNGDKYLIRKYAQFELDDRHVAFKLPKRGVSIMNEYVSEDELDKYAYTHPYVLSRGISQEVINLFDLGYDKDFEKFEAITFPYKEADTGRTLLIGRRALPPDKRFDYPHGKTLSLYGVWELQVTNTLEDEAIYITESAFNALSLWTIGRKAIALSGTGNKEHYNNLYKLPYRRYVIATDTGDAAGMNGAKKLYNALKNSKILQVVLMPTGKDINDILMERGKEGLAEYLSKKTYNAFEVFS